MDGIVDRSFQGQHDLERAFDLLLASRAYMSKDRAPTVKRLALLATSRLWEPNEDAHLWEAAPSENDSDRTLAGLALLWRREEFTPHVTLEVVTGAGGVADALAQEMLDWALNRALA